MPGVQMSGDAATGYYAMQACWCVCTLVLTVLYLIQVRRWWQRYHLPNFSQHGPSTCTKIFLTEATLALPLWIAKGVDPYSQILASSRYAAYCEFVATIVPGFGVVITAAMIVSLLRSVTTTSRTYDNGTECINLERVQLLLYVPAVCLLLLSVIITPIMYATDSTVVQGAFMTTMAVDLTSQLIMFNYSSWRLKANLRHHIAQMGTRDHQLIDNAVTKLRRLQALWSLFFIICSVLLVVLALPRLMRPRNWAYAITFDPNTLTVDYFEWLLAAAFGICFFYCWTPAVDSCKVFTDDSTANSVNMGLQRQSSLLMLTSQIAYPQRSPNHHLRSPSSRLQVAVVPLSPTSPRPTMFSSRKDRASAESFASSTLTASKKARTTAESFVSTVVG